MADMSRYARSRWIKSDDVESGPFVATIAKVDEDSSGFDGEKQPTLTLTDGRKCGLNSTNSRAMVGLFGPESDDWVGQRIEFFASKEGWLRVRAVPAQDRPAAQSRPSHARAAPSPAPASAPAELNDDDIPF